MRQRRVVGNYGMKNKGPKRQKQTQEHDKKNIKKGVGKVCWFMSKTQRATSPPGEGESAGTEGDQHTNYVNRQITERSFPIFMSEICASFDLYFCLCLGCACCLESHSA